MNFIIIIQALLCLGFLGSANAFQIASRGKQAHITTITTSTSASATSAAGATATADDSPPPNNDDNPNALRVGFLGCGTIASAIATGLATQSKIPVKSIAVTKRSESKSKMLSEAFPSLVTIHENNQDVLDQSDVVFHCVLPQLSSDILQALEFDKDRHTLVSLVSTARIDELIHDSKLDTARVSKMICLPAIARHQGVCLLCSPIPNPSLEALFEAVGGVLSVETEDELSACMMTTCVMGPLYGIMKKSRDWLVRNSNISQSQATYLVAKQYQGIVQDAVINCDDPNRLDDLVAEQTPGGLNEQALRNLEILGGLEAYDKVMDDILSRITGKSDGSVKS